MTTTTLTGRVADAFNRGDVGALSRCFAVDAVQYHPFFPEPMRGREAILAGEGAMFAAFDNIEFSIVSEVANGNNLAFEYRVKALNTKPIAMPDGSTIPATNKWVDLTGSAFVERDEAGEIAVSRRYQDNLAMMMQLGLSG